MIPPGAQKVYVKLRTFGFRLYTSYRESKPPALIEKQIPSWGGGLGPQLAHSLRAPCLSLTDLIEPCLFVGGYRPKQAGWEFRV